VPYEPRSISFLGREGRVKHYGIGTHDRVPRPALSEATREAAHGVIPEDAVVERKAWLEHVLKSGDVEGYLEQSLADVEL
jgi:hypothetical protein